MNEANWHSMSAGGVLQALGANEHGLTSAEAAARLEKHGPNELPTKPPLPFWTAFLRQFRNPLIYILGAAVAFALSVQEYTDAGFIGAVLLVNALIGGIQEWKAERASRALQKLIVTRATVTREGEGREVAARGVVPGDIVWLESGNRVPADIRLLHARGLELDESLLTGESQPVAKDASWVGIAAVPLAERRNMCFAGSVVARGRGHGVAVATGSRTSVGDMALEIASRGMGRPPLMARLERFSRLIGVAVLFAVAVVVALGIFLHSRSLEEMFMLAVALGVSAIPEGLPVALTIVLAIATARMARRGVVVRRLAAVEGLGSCTLIASDKTGTLTCNEITVQRVVLPDGVEFDVTGTGYTPRGEIRRDGATLGRGDDPQLDTLARAVVLCNEAALHRSGDEWRWRGDPTDVALLAFGVKAGMTRETLEEDFEPVNQIPFEPERKYAAAFHRARDGYVCFVKGAPERVLAMCRSDVNGTTAYPDPLRVANDMGEQGFRVLAVADGHCAAVDPAESPHEPKDLTLRGFVAMIDPLREGAVAAVTACRDAGINVAMVTGDHPITALAISRQLGLAGSADEVLTGGQMERLTPDQLSQRIAATRVFARTTPQQKLQIVHAGQKGGHFVAVTGDGVNDAPALRAANIGVAMGRSGTDVAREAAELVISDDNFATIVAGVEEGRVAYDNLRKVIFLLVSTGAAEVILVLLSVALGMPVPLLPVQLLWLNLVTNGIQDIALAFEPREGNVLARPPRPPRERIFNRLMIERVVVSALVMGLIGFGLFRCLLDAGWEEAAARNGLLLLFVLFENVHIGNCRSETQSLLRLSPLKNPFLLITAATALVLHVGTMYFEPAQHVLGTQPLDLNTWLLLAGLALSLAIVMELHKLIRRRWPIR